MSAEAKKNQRKKGYGVEFRANNSVTIIDESGLVSLSPEQVSSSIVGLKGFGLAALPSCWAPRFLVVCAEAGLAANRDDSQLSAWVADFFGNNRSKRLIVRSSGTREDMQNRGQLTSVVCDVDEVCKSINRLTDQLDGRHGVVHWVVQEFIQPVSKGHLSNERHLRREPRDWIAEFEVEEGLQPGPVPISIRKWREGNEIDEDLSCSTSFSVSLVLRKVAKWGWQYAARRLHFEWVWDGERLWIVQAEVEVSDKGVDPHALLPPAIAKVSVPALKLFRVADASDYSSLGKLRNAELYSRLGYSMPTFYRAPSESYFPQILKGEVTSELTEDLRILTQRPLILRTDGVDIPQQKREMLPRSDELRTPTEAENWLLREFVPKIKESELDDCDITLIAHHFIPSVASAWARAEPNERIVRIESLWGIPEGLYYFAHDTFEIDTMSVTLNRPVLGVKEDFSLRQRLRYKGSFVGPDQNGEWITQQTKPPYDWVRSIRRNDWLLEIAKTTRFIAEECGFPVSVMWFIDNHPSATSHRVLPWFHSKSEIGKARPAAPGHKYARAYALDLTTVDDWEQLKEAVERKELVDRVLLHPTDPELIRNPDFAKQLGAFASKNNIVIELSGGILSHAFYLLQRSGAIVECVDLYGTDDEVIEFNKVVRDKIPEIIRKGGEHVETVRLEGDALVRALQKKLVEESFEAMDAKSGVELMSELADVEEVIRSICKKLNVTIEQLEQTRLDKNRKRGSFEGGLMLTRTSIPHSVHGAPTENDEGVEDTPAIRDVSNLPTRQIYRRPDLIRVNQLPEKRLAFELEVSDLGVELQPLHFSIPIDGVDREFKLIVDLDRKSSNVRGLIRLRLEPLQLSLDFPKT